MNKPEWEDELNNILIDYDFDKDAPGTFEFVEAEKKIKKLIHSLLKQQWISVKDKMPELDKRILVYVKDYHIDRDQTNTDKILFGYLRGSGKIRPDGCLGDFNVTHWMPLPEPPTTEKK